MKQNTTLRLTPDAIKLLEWLVEGTKKRTGSGSKSGEVETLIRNEAERRTNE